MASIDQALLASLDLVFAQDVEGRFVYISSMTARAFGASRDRLVGRILAELNLPPAVVEQLQVNHHAIFTTGQALTGEVRFPAFYSDQLRDYEYTFSPVLGQNGQIEAAVFIGKDITQRKQAEIALQESEKKYRLLFESANDAIFIMDRATFHILNANWSAARRLGYSRRELLQLTIDDIAIPLEPELQDGILEQLEAEGSIIYEHRYRRKDGAEIPVEINAQLIEYEEQLAIQCFVRDISQRKQAEDSLRQQQQQLASIAANFPGAIYREVLSSSGQVTLPFVSEGIQDVCGYPSDQLMADPTLLPQSIHPGDRPLFIEQLQDSRQTLQSLDQEYRICPMGNQTRWVREVARFFRDEDGNTIADGVIIDVTDRKEAQIALQRQLDQERLLRQVVEHIHQSLNLDSTLQLIVEDVRQYLQTDRVLIFRFNSDWTGEIVVEAVSDPSLSVADWGVRLPHPDLDSFLSGNALFASDIHHSDLQQSYTDLLFHQAQVRAMLTVPIMVQQEGDTDQDPAGSPVVRLWGILMVHHCSDIREWQDFEVDLLQKLATQAGIGIYQAELYRQLQVELQERRRVEAEIRVLNAELEQRVLQRTEQLRRTNVELADEVAERLRVEVALRESNQRYETLAALAPVGIFRTDASGRCIYYNQCCCEILERSHLASFQHIQEHYLYPEDQAWVSQTWMDALARGVPYRVECRFIKPKGDSIWAIIQGHPELGTGGQILGFVSTITDITELKRIEEESRTSQERLQTLIDALPFGIWARDAEERLILQNPVDMQRFGNMLGTLPGELDCEAEVIALYQQLCDLCQPDRVLEYETVEVWNGEDRYLLRLVCPFPDFDGRYGLMGVVIDITERKQAELALRQSEALFRSLFETAAVGIVLTDRDYRILQVNQKLCALLGYTEAELRSLNFRDCTDPDDLPIFEAAFNQLVQGIVPNCSIEQRCIRKDGSLLWSKSTISVASDGVDSLERYCIIVDDLSDRKQAELALQDSEARFRTIFNNAGFGIVVAEPPSYDLRFCNAAFQSLVGFSAEELAEITFAELTYPDDLSHETALVEACLAGGLDRYQLEKRYVHKNGDVVWVNLMSTIVRDSHQQIRFAIGLVEDITTRKLNEAAQLQSELALQRSEARQRAILQAIPDMLFWIRRDGMYLEVIGRDGMLNFLPAGENVQGRYMDELLPTTISNRQQAAIEEAIATGITQHYEQELSFGNQLQYEEVRVSRGDDQTALLMIRDISDHKRAERQLQEMRERYELAITGIGEAIWDWDIIQDRTYVSARFWDMMGYPVNAQESYSTADFLAMLHPEDRCHVELVTRQHLEHREPFNTEYRVRHQLGHYIWIRDRAQAIWNAAGQPVRMIGTWADITEFKRLGEALRQSEASYRAMVELQTNLVCRFRPDGTLTFVNEAYCAFFKKSAEELLGRNWLEFVPAESRSALQDYLASLGTDKPTGEYEHAVIGPSGDLRWYRWSDRVLLDDEGKPMEFQCVSSDITERKLLERALAQYQDILHDIVMQFGGAIAQFRWHSIEDFRLELASGKCEQIFGSLPQDLMEDATLWSLYIEPDDIDAAILPAWVRLLEGQADSVVYRFRRIDGLMWIEGRAIARYDIPQAAWIITTLNTPVTDAC
ncbi:MULTISPECIES: PAS domain S-box protein [unclassified Leptolyngbya]|uniref:PAS domain S-box protein n=1 Tax=unclassified Leptolyngbya TaxID=2650499 RepID=UPI0016875B59|nr:MULTISPECIES: PAS domain S-box protein [unclassified Leptolyngbya]MBD1909679.1 PAS domain S-box protein [Leptolyngbya sp. FACHB-8]MBD2157544.1 PAS domain S-box protein [Leptolyngbya sp. FACHB-16]